MTEQENEIRIVSVMMLSVKQFNNDELCAMNIALHLYRRVDSLNMSYDKALKYHLIHRDGTPHEIDYLKKRVLLLSMNVKTIMSYE